MKKILFTTTTLAALMASAAFAEGPQVGVGGKVDFQVGVRSQKKEYTNNNNLTHNQKDVAFNNRAKVYVKAMNKSDQGLVYGGVASLKTNAQQDNSHLSNQLDRTYMFLESGFGRLELGSNYSAAKSMRIDAGTVAAATGGATYGDWSFYANTNTGANYAGNYYFSSDLYSDYLVNQSYNEEVRKVTYFTPNMYGFQAGVSYSADSVNNGLSTPKTMNTLGFRDFKDVVSGGLNYTQQMDQMTFAVSATGETGKASNIAGQDTPGKKPKLNSYNLGASLAYANFGLAASYGAVDKKTVVFDLVTPNMNKKGVKFWSAGLSYGQGPVGASVTYFASNFQKNKLKNVALGVDYKMAPGLKAYSEFYTFELRSSDTSVKKNKGNVFLVGSEFAF